MTIKPLLILSLLSLLFYSCASTGNLIPTETGMQFNQADSAKFNAAASHGMVTINKGEHQFSGFLTHNKDLVEEIINPAVQEKLDELKKLPPRRIINELTILTYNVFQHYIGKSFYRWGGDILDLDDPQSESIRFEKSYGLDCSGFTTAGYELAVYFGLLTPAEALFSSKGFEGYCSLNNIEDSGGLENTPNNFRVDTKELIFLGDEVIKIKKNTRITDEQLSLVQEGDIMGLNGHFGIIVSIEGGLYYLESGGWVSPEYDYKPAPLRDAVNIFAKQGDIYIRRCL